MTEDEIKFCFDGFFEVRCLAQLAFAFHPPSDVPTEGRNALQVNGGERFSDLAELFSAEHKEMIFKTLYNNCVVQYARFRCKGLHKKQPDVLPPCLLEIEKTYVIPMRHQFVVHDVNRCTMSYCQYKLDGKRHGVSTTSYEYTFANCDILCLLSDMCCFCMRNLQEQHPQVLGGRNGIFEIDFAKYETIGEPNTQDTKELNNVISCTSLIEFKIQEHADDDIKSKFTEVLGLTSHEMDIVSMIELMDLVVKCKEIVAETGKYQVPCHNIVNSCYSDCCNKLYKVVKASGKRIPLNIQGLSTEAKEIVKVSLQTRVTLCHEWNDDRVDFSLYFRDVAVELYNIAHNKQNSSVTELIDMIDLDKLGQDISTNAPKYQLIIQTGLEVVEDRREYVTSIKEHDGQDVDIEILFGLAGDY